MDRVISGGDLGDSVLSSKIKVPCVNVHVYSTHCCDAHNAHVNKYMQMLHLFRYYHLSLLLFHLRQSNSA